MSKDLFTFTDDFMLAYTLSVIKMSLAEMNLSFAGCGFMGVYHIDADF